MMDKYRDRLQHLFLVAWLTSGHGGKSRNLETVFYPNSVLMLFNITLRGISLIKSAFEVDSWKVDGVKEATKGGG